MKIGIITFWQSQDNYGQILQGYALQQTLTNIGHKSFIIRYGFHEKCFPESYDERIFAKLHVFFYYKVVKDALKTFKVIRLPNTIVKTLNNCSKT